MRKEKVYLLQIKQVEYNDVTDIFLYPRSYTLKYLNHFFSLNMFFRMNTSEEKSFKIIHHC